MQIIKTIVFGVILVLMFGYYYLYEVKKFKEINEQKEEAKIVFPNVKKDDINKITVKGEAREVVLQKEVGEWMLKSPVIAKGDQKSVDLLTENLVELKMERVIDEGPDSYKEFGLENPGLRIEFGAGQGKNSLLIGNDNPTNTLVYGKTGENPRVLGFSSYKKGQFDKNVYDLRDKAILPLEKDQIKGLFIVKGDIRLEAVLSEEKNWEVIEPFKWRGNKGKIEGIIHAILDSKVIKFVSEEPDNLKEYGLDTPMASFKFITDVKNKSGHTLLIGKKEEEQNRYFTKRKNAGNIFLIDGALIKKIPEKAEEFRDNKLISISGPENVSKIRFSGAEKITVQRDKEDNWELPGPQTVKADIFETNQWLDNIFNIEIKEMLEGKKGNSPGFGLQAPVVTIEIWEKDGKDSQKVFIGSEIGETKDRYVSIGGSQNIFTISGDTYNGLLSTRMKLRDRKLVYFDTEKVEKVEIQKGNTRAELVKSGDKWRLNHSEKELKGNTVRVILWDLIDLRFEKIAAQSEAGLRKFGLDTPSLSIRIFKEKGEKGHEILFGAEVVKDKGKDKKDGPGEVKTYYATNESKKEIFEVKTEMIKDINKQLKSWGVTR